MLPFLAALALYPHSSAPIENQAADALRVARQSAATGNRGRACATLDSLVFPEGVSVAMEAPGAMEPSVERGLEAWNTALGERTFRLRPGGSAADVTVRFVPSLDERGGDVQGFVDAMRTIRWGSNSHEYRLHATIYVRDNVEGRPIRSDEVVNVVAHEAGHLLGLADVAREDRLMGPMVVGRPKAGPLPEEVAAVRDYRSLVRQSYPKW